MGQGCRSGPPVSLCLPSSPFLVLCGQRRSQDPSEFCVCECVCLRVPGTPQRVLLGTPRETVNKGSWVGARKNESASLCLPVLRWKALGAPRRNVGRAWTGTAWWCFIPGPDRLDLGGSAVQEGMNVSQGPLVTWLSGAGVPSGLCGPRGRVSSLVKKCPKTLSPHSSCPGPGRPVSLASGCKWGIYRPPPSHCTPGPARAHVPPSFAATLEFFSNFQQSRRIPRNFSRFKQMFVLSL